jgi:hypothetical protein
VAHKFQRQIADNGAIVAALDDYRHALEAFDEGLSAAHGHIDETVVAVVEAVEKMLEEAPEDDLNPDSVKVSVRDLCKRLRIASTSTAKKRLDEAVSAGALEYDDTRRGGRGRPHYFKVLKSADGLRTGPYGGVFPPAKIVEKIFSGLQGKREQDEQNEQDTGKTRI